MNGPYKIGTLARLTGFSPALLRAWEKRFGLIAPERGDGRQRVYGDDDLAVLRRVRTLVDQGRAIGEIAAQGRGRLLTGGDREPSAAGKSGPQSGVDAPRDRIVAGALALDARKLGNALDEAFAALGADRTVADVVVPAAIQIGDLWEADRCSVASEHMASSRFLHCLGRLLDAAQPVSDAAPRVIAACFPDENHELGLLIVSWHLARHGVRVEYLGSSMPLEDLAKACRTSAPQAVLLSVMRESVFVRNQRALARLFSDSPDYVFVGGQGVPRGARSANRRIVLVRESSVTEVVRHVVSTLHRAAGRPRTAAARRQPPSGQ